MSVLPFPPTGPERFDERRDGIIVFIDRITRDGRQAVIEDIPFSGDHKHMPTR